MSQFIPVCAGFILMALPALADHLDPRVAGPLSAMFQSAAAQCQQGNQQACYSAQRMREVEIDLSRAEHACRDGNPQACQYFQNGAQQVVGAWQQQMQAGMIQGSIGVPGGGGGPGYSTQQMTQDHQARMQQQQQQFQQHQNQMQQQQRLNDQQNQRFLEQLRR